VIGKITEVGNTSRKMVFEAYKVITSTQDHVHDSACDVLDPPILVAKASGTCVVLKEKQRKGKQK
jgi:3-aminobutyryl-CoA ammonia-lyase